MLVVGGIQPGFNNMQPADSSGCDGHGKFAQGLGLFSLNSHTWTTAYDPVAGSAPYQVHSNISSVIGGGQSGGATLQTPVNGFTQKELGTVLGVKPEPTSATKTVSEKKGLSRGIVAAIAIGAIVAFALLIGAASLWFLPRRRRQGRLPASAPSTSSNGNFSRPAFFSELHGSMTHMELSGGEQENQLAKAWTIAELTGEGPPQKPLTLQPQYQTEKKVLFKVQEMKAQEVSPISPQSGRSG